MKKQNVLVLFLMLFVIFVFAGCGVKVKTLSQEETSLVAEYIAGTVLSHSTNYNERLILDKTEIKATEEPSQASPQPHVQQTMGPKDTSPPSTSHIPVSTTLPKSDPSVMELSGDVLNDIYNFKNIEFKYTNYVFANHYKNNKESLVLAPLNGQQLMVFRFSVKNLSSKTKIINLLQEKVKYSLTVNGDKQFKPLGSILDDHIMQYLNVEIEAKKSAEAVLVFSIPKDIALKTLELDILKSNKKAVIKLH